MVEKQMLTLEKNPLKKGKMFSFQQRYVTIKSVWSDAISIKRAGSRQRQKIKNQIDWCDWYKKFIKES